MGLFRAFRGLFAGAAGGQRAEPPPPAPYARALTRPAAPAAPGSSPGQALSPEGRGIADGDGVDWAEVRRVYEEGEVPLKAIQARFKISRRRLRQAYLDGGWRLRPQIAKPGPRQGQRPKTTKPRLRPGQRRNDPKGVARRLLRLAGERLAQLEEAAAGGAAAQPTAEELKAMAELARALPALMREDRLLGGAGGQAAESEAERAAAAERSRKEELEPADIEFMRAELMQRLDVLAAEYRRQEQEGNGEAFLAELQERYGWAKPAVEAS